MPVTALVQHPPSFLNRAESVELAVTLIAQAASSGASLVVFTESFIPGYPAWIWRLRPGSDSKILAQLHALLSANAVTMGDDSIKALCDAAARHRITLVCGVVERDDAGSRSTLYNTVLVIGPDGAILNRHRKLVPTNAERTIWGHGDGRGLKAVETPAGRLGTLICWENYLPLARHALYAQGIEVYIAPSYDSGDNWINAMQYIALESGCWVLGCGMALRASDLPADLPGKELMYPAPEEWVNCGDSVIVAPGGAIVAGPLHAQNGILLFDLDLNLVTAARRSLDVVGHSGRPDLMSLQLQSAPYAALINRD
jgi:nitrilase